MIQPPLIYLAGPYSHPDPDRREERASQLTRIAAQLMAQGHVVFSPITHGHAVVEHLPPECAESHDYWMHQCTVVLSRCNILLIVTFPGWETSRGIAHEVLVAEKHGLRVQYLHPHNNFTYIPKER